MSGRFSFISFTIFLVITAFLLGNAGRTEVVLPSHGEKFYYFNPDSPQSNMARLKGAMDSFLKKANFPVAFTPFTRFNDFDRLTLDMPPKFVLLPQWYFQENRDKMQFVPLLVPTRDGPSSYRKVLLTSKQSDISLQTLSQKTLAMTFMGDRGRARLNRLLFARHQLSVDDLNIVITPKDSDSLFALALGQVDMALVSKVNLDNIARINPRISEAVRPLAQSEPISLPILCYLKGGLSQNKIDEIKNLFLASNSKTNLIMEMLEFDGWQEYSN